MDNVLDITSRLPERPALDVDLPLEIIKRVFAAGKISAPAYHIGMIVLSEFQRQGTYNCELTRAQMHSIYTLVDDEPNSGGVRCELDEFCAALRMLQHVCGIHNHTNRARVGKGERGRHFTEQYLHKGPDALFTAIKGSTPIYFYWDHLNTESLIEEVRAAITHGMLVARFATITTKAKS